jgi:hypothetical protein
VLARDMPLNSFGILESGSMQFAGQLVFRHKHAGLLLVEDRAEGDRWSNDAVYDSERLKVRLFAPSEGVTFITTE